MTTLMPLMPLMPLTPPVVVLVVLAGLATAGAVTLALPPHPRTPDQVTGSTADPAVLDVDVTSQGRGGDRRRLAGSVLAGLGAALFLGGPLTLPVGLVVAGLCWWWLGTVEPADVRRARERSARDLPTLVALVAAGLRAGAAAPAAIRLACQALPGPATDRLEPVAHRLALGADEAQVWQVVSRDVALAPLGRTMARAHETGSSVVDSVEQLATELDEELRASAEARARTVGVKAALPLGLCLLPSFLLLGIVPLAAGLFGQITR